MVSEVNPVDRDANETVVAAGVLLITVYLQSHVFVHPYSFRSAHNSSFN